MTQNERKRDEVTGTETTGHEPAMPDVWWLVLLVPTEQFPVGQLNPGGYEAYGILGATLMFIAIVASSLGTHRHIPDLNRCIFRMHLSAHQLKRRGDRYHPGDPGKLFEKFGPFTPLPHGSDYILPGLGHFPDNIPLAEKYTPNVFLLILGDPLFKHENHDQPPFLLVIELFMKNLTLNERKQNEKNV